MPTKSKGKSKAPPFSCGARVSSRADSEAAGYRSEACCSRQDAVLRSVALGLGTVVSHDIELGSLLCGNLTSKWRPQNSKTSVRISLKIWNAIFLKMLTVTSEGTHRLSTPYTYNPSVLYPLLYLILPHLETMKTFSNGTLVSLFSCSGLFWCSYSHLWPCPALKVCREIL